jgi:ankyrin repeat protein
MPRALNDAFRLTMERVKNQTSDIAEQALNILKWIFLAERPLTLEELRHALAIEPGLEELDEEDFIDPESIFEGCFGLVTMDKATSTLRLVHKSLQDYLDTQYEEGQLFQGGHGEIALACLTYISFDIPDFIHLVMEDEVFRTYALLEYAFYNWGNHARKEKTRSTPNEIVTLLRETHDSHPFFQRLLTWPIRRNFGENKQYLTAPKLQIGEDDVGSQNLALVVAAFFGAESVVRGLVDCQDIDVNAQDAGERVALSWAAGRGYIAIVELLIHHKDIEIDIKDMGGLTPLAIAAKAGHREVVRVLLERNADVNTKDDNGRTALSLATRGGHTEVVRVLLDAGAVVDPEDTTVRTTLSIAAYENHTDILELLLERGANINAKGKYDRNPLSYAVDIGCEEIVRLLLDRGGDVDERDSRGRTAVSLAAESGWQDILSLLVERGFAIDLRDNNGRTPLSYAAGVVYRDTRFYNGHVEYKHGGVLELLLKNGAEVNCKDNLGRTPLSWAAQAGHAKTLSTLLERGADINSQDLQGRTPLIWSVVTDTESYSDDIVRLLLDHKDVDVNLVDKNYGMTALAWAEDLDIEEAEDMLRAYGNK